MLDNQFINNIIGVKEAYQMPEKLMDILFDRVKREGMFDKFLEREPDLSYDWFTQYYQEEHGDRDKLKQNFTPDSICQIVTGLNGHAENEADISGDPAHKRRGDPRGCPYRKTHGDLSTGAARKVQ